MTVGDVPVIHGAALLIALQTFLHQESFFQPLSSLSISHYVDIYLDVFLLVFYLLCIIRLLPCYMLNGVACCFFILLGLAIMEEALKVGRDCSNSTAISRDALLPKVQLLPLD